MASFSKSDYAVNKFSEGIVYRFSNQTIEVTLEDYLAENPDKTEQDFRELKALSDGIYRRESLDIYNQCRMNISISCLEPQPSPAPSPEDAYIDAQEYRKKELVFRDFLKNGKLTDIQRKRFLLYVVNGLTMRDIAKQEGVCVNAIAQSIYAAKCKYKKYFQIYE